MHARVDTHASLIAGALLAFPSLAAHYLPMTDLPLHEGAVGLLRHYGDDSYVPPELYRLNLGHPNQLFYLLAWVLSYVVGTAWAVKLVIAAAQFMIFWTGAKLADHLGRSHWAVLLLAPLALGFTYYWGLVPNLLGFAAFLGALPVLDRAAATPSARGVVTSCALLLLAFFAHESVFVAAAGFVALLVVAHPFERRKTAVRLAPFAFAVVVAVAHQVYAARFFTGVVVVDPVRFTPLPDRLVSLPNVLFGAHDAVIRLVLVGLCLLAIALFVSARRRSEARGVAAQSGLLYRHRYELTAAVLVVLCFAMPFNFRGATMVWQRFVGPAWALTAICSAPRADAPRLAKLVASVVPVAVLLVSWPQFADASATSRDLDVIIAAVPKNSAVALTVVERPTEHTRVYSATTGPARIVAERGGRVGLSLAMSPFAPLQLRPEYRWDDYDRRTVLAELGAIQPSHDLDRFGWLIAQSHTAEGRTLLIAALQPDAELVKAQGE
ncbi:MAG: hypothetical protein JWP87_3102, partial [Labilithrix sp.]|nr:hypothetical protein [Labilithrix sp.]